MGTTSLSASDPVWHKVRGAIHIGGAFGGKADLGPEARAAIELAKAARAPAGRGADRGRPAQELNLSLATSSEAKPALFAFRAYGDLASAVGNITSSMFRIMQQGAARPTYLPRPRRSAGLGRRRRRLI